MKDSTKNVCYFSMLIVTGILFLSISCDVIGEKGSGNVVRTERKVEPFNSVGVSGAFDVFLSQGATQSVIIEADDNIMDMIETEVFGGKLIVKNTKPIRNPKSMKVYITVTELRNVDLSGAVDLLTQTRITAPSLKINISGVSDSKFEIIVDKLVVKSSGGSELQLTGTASELRMDISGAVDLHAFDLQTNICYMEISGAGEAEINVKDELYAELSGAASIIYRGNPTKLIEEISGAGSIKKAR